MADILKTPLGYLKKIGPQRSKLLAGELGLEDFGDLAGYLPFRYIDRTKILKISELSAECRQYVQIKATVLTKGFVGRRLQATVSDGTGTVSLVWFNYPSWFPSSLNVGTEYVIFGRPDMDFQTPSIAHPDMETSVKYMAEVFKLCMQGVYSITEKLSRHYITSKTIYSYQKELWKTIRGHIPETLPSYLIDHLSLMGREEALFNAHFPSDPLVLEKAVYRLKFEELLAIQIAMTRYRTIRHETSSGYIFKRVGEKFNAMYTSLPFGLTDAQKRVVKEIRADMCSSHQMNRLLQGDVGSGKTVVAVLTAMIAADNGYQTAIMVPTEILARQHYATISGMCAPAGVNVALLTGSVGNKDRREIDSGLMSGRIDILVGTHALIEDNVQFRNLGYVVIDEQHRFGVEQRGKIWHKGFSTPHVLVMTATPIPRTLAMTIYGDLDVSVIDSKPVGRKPIITRWCRERDRNSVYYFIKREIAAGHQIYVVFPLIKESEKLDYKNLEVGVQALETFFPHPHYSNVVVHGQMEQRLKDYGMQQFKDGKAQILVSTTVIEVGVDVPNATVILIESAERFGLSQLHQLRGRVGRSDLQSHCILMTSDNVSSETGERMKAMERTNDGFELSELDLKLRGAGDLEGTRQSGQLIDFKIANPVKDTEILQVASREAENILAADPTLSHPDNKLLKEMSERTHPAVSEFDLGTIS